MKPLPKKYQPTEKHIFELVSKRGVSKTICINKFGLPRNYFQFKGATDNFNSAMAHFTSDILMKSVADNLNFDSANRKYLMQKNRVFDAEIDLPIKKMTCASHASQNLSYALNAYAKKEIGEETLMQIRSACSVFSDLMVATTLQSEVKALQKNV